MVPHDVPFDERLFESNSLLKQYWETSVNGRSSMASLNVQRSAQEDDHKHQTLEFYNNLVTTTAPKESVVEPEPVEEASVLPPEVHEVVEVRSSVAQNAAIPLPRASGPVMQPKAVSYGISVISLVLVIVVAVLAASVALYYYGSFPVVSVPVVGRVLGGGEVVTETVAEIAQAAAPTVASITAGRIARFEL